MSGPNYPQQHPYGAASRSIVPLWAPYYGASMTIAVKRFFQKYVIFAGRASRSEFWWWMLVSFVVSILLSGLNALLSDGGFQSGNNSTIVTIISGLWTLAILLPSIAVTVRRLHDTNRSGWWYVLNFIPILGGIVVLILTLLPSNPAGRQYDDPDDRPTPTNNKGPAFR
jgi:uncharacterized membrane protein YhaH (DUF805 family)